MLKGLEDDLLSRLSSAGGNILGDTALVENLETTKRTAAEIEEKVMRSSVGMKHEVILLLCGLNVYQQQLYNRSSDRTLH